MDILEQIEIKEELKNHYIFEKSIEDILDLYKHIHHYWKVRGNSKPENIITLRSIAKMIVYKYFMGELSFAQRAFIVCSKFKEFPFVQKIKDLEQQLKN